MKKLVSLLLAACMCLAICVMATGCNSSKTNGTYYLYDNGTTDKSSWVKIEGSKWSDSDGMSGTFKLDGKSISFYVKWDGKDELLLDGTLENGKLTVGNSLASVVYYLDGKAPTDSDGNKDDSASEQAALSAFTYEKDGKGYCITGVTDKNVTNLVVPDIVTKISNCAFAGCDKLESITLPGHLFIEKDDGWGGKLTVSVAQFFEKGEDSDRVGNQFITFDQYYTPESLKKVTITGDLEDAKSAFPESNGKRNDGKISYLYTAVESIIFDCNLKSIGDYTFRSAVSPLKEISIPNTVTSIGQGIFEYQKSVQHLYYAGTKAEWEAIDKASNWFRDAHLSNLTVHCTDGDIAITENG